LSVKFNKHGKLSGYSFKLSTLRPSHLKAVYSGFATANIAVSSKDALCANSHKKQNELISKQKEIQAKGLIHLAVQTMGDAIIARPPAHPSSSQKN
jgi:hypothetical protein